MKTISYPEHWPQFYTATITTWQHLLSSNECFAAVAGTPTHNLPCFDTCNGG
ncbi:MAG: hypothetical protein IPP48_15660 [Chitinophagaceae bacterium]|nr:hypothetical protein [Chitinophagaceae bacterium]